MAAQKPDPMEVPTGDDEDSPCIGESEDPEITLVNSDVESGPESTEVYGSRWS